MGTRAMYPAWMRKLKFSAGPKGVTEQARSRSSQRGSKRLIALGTAFGSTIDCAHNAVESSIANSRRRMAALAETIGEPGSELEGILLEARRRVVQERIQHAGGKGQPLVYRNIESRISIGRVGTRNVPRGRHRDTLREPDALAELLHEVFAEDGADQVLIVGGRLEGLARIADAGLEVERCVGLLDDGPADAAAVVLLQIEALRVVVIEGRLHEAVYVLATEVFVVFRVGVHDLGFHLRGVGLIQEAAGGAEVEGGAIARVQPRFRGNGADQVQAAGEGAALLGGFD